MAEVFTISGPPEVQLLGPAAGSAPCPNAKTLAIAGGVSRIGSLGLGGYGAYKMFQKGWAPGVLSLVGAAALWFSGSRLLTAAQLAREACGSGK